MNRFIPSLVLMAVLIFAILFLSDRLLGAPSEGANAGANQANTVSTSETVAKGSVRGVVVDKKTKLPLQRAIVRILGTQKGGFTDKLGRFEVRNIPVGIYEAQASYVGYSSIKMKVLITDSANTECQFCLPDSLVYSTCCICLYSERINKAEEQDSAKSCGTILNPDLPSQNDSAELSLHIPSDVFPNPCTRSTTLKLDLRKHVRLRIDVIHLSSGAVVQQFDWADVDAGVIEKNIQLDGLLAGSYTVAVQASNGDYAVLPLVKLP